MKHKTNPEEFEERKKELAEESDKFEEKITYRTKSGKVLTDEDIEALSKEAEEGYDLDESSKNRLDL